MTRDSVERILHEKEDDAVLAIYPDGIHGQIASFLEKQELIRKQLLWKNQNMGLQKTF